MIVVLKADKLPKYMLQSADMFFIKPKNPYKTNNHE